MRRVASAILIAILSAGCEPSADAQPAEPVSQGQGFDFYVLSLSWSPSYCAAEGGVANRQHCSSGRKHGFVVLGWWPQFEYSYPECCPSRVPERV
ncbi:MAG: ribonuclease, partial [Beijerinckiaceae bacterium]